MNSRDYPTINDLLGGIKQHLNINGPFDIHANRRAYDDTLEFRIMYDPMYKLKDPFSYNSPLSSPFHRPMKYIVVTIPKEDMMNDLRRALQPVIRAFEQMKYSVYYQENFFKALHPLTRHIGGHPLEHTLNLDFNTV